MSRWAGDQTSGSLQPWCAWGFWACGGSDTNLNIFLMLVMVIPEAPCDIAELLTVPFHPHNGSLDAL